EDGDARVLDDLEAALAGVVDDLWHAGFLSPPEPDGSPEPRSSRPEVGALPSVVIVAGTSERQRAHQRAVMSRRAPAARPPSAEASGPSATARSGPERAPGLLPWS